MMSIIRSKTFLWTFLFFFFYGESYNQEQEVERSWLKIRNLYANKYKRNVRYDERLDIVTGLIDLNTQRSVDLLVKALDLPFSIIESTARKLNSLKEELETIQRGLTIQSKPNFSVKTEKRIRELKFICKKLSVEILNEKRIIQRIKGALIDTKDPSVLKWLKDYAMRELAPSLPRIIILEALAVRGIKEAKNPLLKMLNHKKTQFRVVAVNTLSNLKEEDVLQAIIVKLEDESWQVRAAAISVLEKWKEWKSVRSLIEALGRDDGRLREDLSKTLSEITGETLGLNYQAWKDWFDKQTGSSPNKGRKKSSSKTGEGYRYYGITTYSKRIIFIIPEFCTEFA